MPANARVQVGSVLAQNIVAHIQNPKDHIKITACVFEESESDVVILDTVNQLSNRSELSCYYLCALLNSRLIKWFVCRFIFTKAIRTIHFDSSVSDRIPIVNALLKPQSKELYDEISDKAQSLIAARDELQSAQTETDKNYSERKIISLDRQLDELVYRLY